MYNNNNNTTAERVKELVFYNPDSGDFNRLKKDGSLGIRTGFTHNSNDYGRIRIDGIEFLAHRICHLFMTDE